MEIRWELKIINCGNEPIETRPSETRPWAILAFVTGHKTEDMCSNNTQRITVESIMRSKFSTLGLNFTTVKFFQNVPRVH